MFDNGLLAPSHSRKHLLQLSHYNHVPTHLSWSDLMLGGDGGDGLVVQETQGARAKAGVSLEHYAFLLTQLPA